MYVTRNCLILVALLLLCASCHHLRRMPYATLDDVKVFRDYRLATDDADPQAAWAPNDYRIIVRSKRGLGLLKEGPGQQKFFNTKDYSRVGWPTWLDERRVVVGSPQFMVKTENGELTQSAVKLRMLVADEMKLEDRGFIGDEYGYYPRVLSDQRFLGQKGESIIEYHSSGTAEEYDQGFFALPQPNGPGVCLQTAPIQYKDHWTGKKDNGALLVRWEAGNVALFPDCFQPSWCADGGILATRLNGNVRKAKSWKEIDSDIVYIKPGSKELKVVKKHAHSPAAHPVDKLGACIGRAGFLYLINYEDASFKEIVPEGERPQWSFDGNRLLTEVDGRDGSKLLRIWVFRHRLEAGQEGAKP